MATLLTTKCNADLGGNAELPEAIPSPEKVRATAAVIRRSWSPRTRRHRAQLARSILVEQFFAPLLGPLEPVLRLLHPPSAHRQQGRAKPYRSVLCLRVRAVGLAQVLQGQRRR